MDSRGIEPHADYPSEKSCRSVWKPKPDEEAGSNPTVLYHKNKDNNNDYHNNNKTSHNHNNKGEKHNIL